MNAIRLKSFVLSILAIAAQSVCMSAWSAGFANGIGDALGPFYDHAPEAKRAPTQQSDRRPGFTVRHWNGIAIDASGLDHTPVAAGEDRVFGEQYGPTRASRAMAIVHIAMFEAVNAIAHRYRSYAGIDAVTHDASMDAAVAQAAHDTLAALFPSQKASFDRQLAADLAAVPDAHTRDAGIALGQRAAAAILLLRANDG